MHPNTLESSFVSYANGKPDQKSSGVLKRKAAVAGKEYDCLPECPPRVRTDEHRARGAAP
jgi:hypothetical protein